MCSVDSGIAEPNCFCAHNFRLFALRSTNTFGLSFPLQLRFKDGLFLRLVTLRAIIY